ncbi:McrB family protein [Winogradskyella undariae]|uniref:McrB family protein n=1 Tax=Winogradskyella undariae TaxID=1285465 RepID=UPI001C2BA879|nr:AAA family ATPase [Winogradskyella undariae]
MSLDKYEQWLIAFDNKKENTAYNYKKAISKIEDHYVNLKGEPVDFFKIKVPQLKEVLELYGLKGKEFDFGDRSKGTNRNALNALYKYRKGNFKSAISQITSDQVNAWFSMTIEKEVPQQALEDNWRYNLAHDETDKKFPFQWAIKSIAEKNGLALTEFKSSLPNRSLVCELFDVYINEELIYDQTDANTFIAYYHKQVSHKELFQSCMDYASAFSEQLVRDPYDARIAISSDNRVMYFIGMRNVYGYSEKNGEAYINFIIDAELEEKIKQQGFKYEIYEYKGGDHKINLYLNLTDWNEIPKFILENHRACLEQEYHEEIKSSIRRWKEDANSTNYALKTIIFDDLDVEDWIKDQKISEHEEFYLSEKVNNGKSAAMNKKNIDRSVNQILYGPPGTGKTFYLKDKLFDKYTIEETSISHDKFFEETVSDLTWWHVVALALLEMGTARVNAILDNRWVAKKASLSESKNVRATLWGTLQMHTIIESKNVAYTQRQAPFIFDKNEDKSWSLLEADLKEQVPELYDLLDKVNNFKANPDKVIKNYSFVTFHQSFAYEDFIEGIKPVLPENEAEEAKDLGYTIEDGVFKLLCTKAKNDPGNRYAIFIDEINRGNVSAIFGELITLIEVDKRTGAKNELRIKLPYSKKEFSVPSNLDIYGTMNTADRSVEALDTALRRRFEFKEMMPDYAIIANGEVEGIRLSNVLKTINERIELLIDREHAIGHSYFVGVETAKQLAKAFTNKIVPLLQEYFYGDYGKIGLVLGKGFVEKIKNDKIEFASFDYENANDFKTATYVLKPVDSTSIIEAIELLLGEAEVKRTK